MTDQQLPGLDRDLVSATCDEFRRRGGVAHRQFAVLLEVGRIDRLVQALAQPHLAPFGLTYAGWQTLMALAYSKHRALPMTKLANRVGAHPTTLTRTIDRLVRLGYVQRVRKAADRRVTVIEILPDGEKARDAVLQARDAAQFDLDGVPESHLGDLVDLLREVRVTLNAHVEATGQEL